MIASSLVSELSMEFLDYVKRIEKDVALIANRHKDLLHHVTKSFKKLQQHISGKGITLVLSESSTNIPRSKVGP